MKTRGMGQQIEALRRMNGRDFYALFMEQGTGKTWVILADAERLYGAGQIDALLVLAPKGVHTNWTRREIPEHMGVPHVAASWSSGMGKRARTEIEKLLRPREDGEPVPLRILAMNYEALTTKDGFDFAARFLRSTHAMIALDESGRVKNPRALRTKRVMRLRPLARVARIATGTPITNSPLDVFSQMEFLESGLLGTTSHRAFIAEFADVVPSHHPMMQRMIQRNPNAAHAQVIARDPVTNEPRYRNLDRLKSLLEPHSYRVMKRECLDLPEKIYKQMFFELTPSQRRVYEQVADELRIEVGGGDVHVVTALSALVKCQQVTSGFVNIEGAPMLVASGDNPRMDALLEVIEDIDGKFIVWARFREELRQIAALLREHGCEAVEYHGGISTAEREKAVDSFQNGAARAFIGQPQSGGIGLTLTAAENVVYFSNDFDMGTRAQSEDRAHRIGTRKNVVYTDIVAVATIDEPIARALQRKQSVAAAILGDVLPSGAAARDNPSSLS